MAQPGFAPAQSSSASILAETIANSSLAVTSSSPPPPTLLTTSSVTTTTATKSRSKHEEDHGTSKNGGLAVGTPTLTKAETVFCGSTAGVVSRFVIAPLDVVKIRLQLQTQRKELPKVLRRKAGSAEGIAYSELKGRTVAIADSLSAATARTVQPRYKGMLSGMTIIAREEGIRGLWKGNMAAEYLYLTYGGIQFLAYQQTKLFLSKAAELSATQRARLAQKYRNGVPVYAQVLTTITQSSSVQSFISGATAGIMATACTYPFDLLRTRFAVQRDVKVYTGVPQAFRHIFRQDGVRGFYRGMTPALIQVIPYMGVMFGSYDSLKQLVAWLKVRAADTSFLSGPSTVSSHNSETSYGSTSDPPFKKKTFGQILLGLEDMACGAMSGVISKTAVYPLDMVRKRLQIQGSEQQRNITGNAGTGSGAPTTVWRCMVHIVRREGYLALYKGLLPGILKAAPASAVTFLVFSQTGALIERARRPQKHLQEQEQ
ncbi:mitochondrial thiamine pyrophosphate transporter [Linnemannia schmuckeri]|uniref:Mitochondrial thiamine pyrophosphate transporter n=1 Tax=Linnemannia schmuckeri TaxID=64567 RepID=A0A9P5RRZ0_9FUNG|nr:mitochondrial thiamine pyrophosphate transporter [Linnemannia schmuckeri]